MSRPRAAMSVATSTSNRPSRKPCQRLLALLLGAVGMQHRHRVVVAFQRVRNAVGPVLGAAEDKHRIVVDPLEQLEQQIGLLRIGNRIDDMLDRFGGRAAGANFNRLRIVHGPLDERFNLRRDGGRKQRRCGAGAGIFPPAGAHRAGSPCPASGRLRPARGIPPCPAAGCRCSR